MGAAKSKESQKNIGNLQRRIDELERHLSQCHEQQATNAVVAVADLVTPECINNDLMEKQHPLSPQISISNIESSSEWEVVKGGCVGIGIGSSYNQDNSITVVNREITSETEAFEWVKKYENEPKYNPIVMWQVGNYGISYGLVAHRLRFMYKDLGKGDGRSPKDFALLTKKWLENRRKIEQCTIYVRSDKWWESVKLSSKASQLKSTSGKSDPYTLISKNKSWEVVEEGGVGIGPGSYYTSDDTITVINREITNEEEAFEWVKSFDNNGLEYNPIVMWQVGNIGINYGIRAHRLRFMYKDLDATTGKSPKDFARATKAFLSKKRNVKKCTIYVRSDKWWESVKLSSKASQLKSTSGKVILTLSSVRINLGR